MYTVSVVYCVCCLPQDPSSIQHQQAESGDVYAMPQAKKSKKGKKREESVSEEEKAAMYSMPDRKGQKAKSEGVSDTHTIPAMCTCIYMYQV